MSPLPTEFRDRWENRAEPAPGRGTVYWHVLMARYEGARVAAQVARDTLSQFSGFHLTPSEWLHMTTYLVGPTEKYSRSQLTDMIAIATEKLTNTTAIRTKISRVLYHPEAIMLAVDPTDHLLQLRNAAETASGGRRQSDCRTSVQWLPHMTVAYSTANQPAGPVINDLRTSIPPQIALIDRLTLVIQWGPERRWDWEPVGEVLLDSTDK